MYLDMSSRDFKTDNPEKEVLIALKLQELVKQSIIVGTPPIVVGYLLQLVKESKSKK